MRGAQSRRPGARRLVALVVAVAATVATVVTAACTPAAATPSVQHLAVPAYFYPGGAGAGYWNRIGQGGAAVGVSVANADSGPGSGFDQAYADVVRATRNAGGKVIGYVDTGYFGTTGRTTRTGATSVSAWTAQVEADVANWYAWYGGYGLSGIFFDDALGDCGTNNAHVNLYAAVNTYTKQNHSGALTVDNPGSAAEQCYSSAADILVLFEGDYASYTHWTPPAWETSSATPDKFWHLVYAAPTQAAMDNAMALSRQRNAGYVYVTPDDLPNPWDTLPTGGYWTDELSRTGA